LPGGCEDVVNRRRGRTGQLAKWAAIAAATRALFDASAFAGQFSLSKVGTGSYGVIDTAAWVCASGATYGRGINGNSFETSTITSFNGYQYTAYWQNSSGAGHVAVARRAIGSGTWETMTLVNTFSSSGNSNDAHNV